MSDDLLALAKYSPRSKNLLDVFNQPGLVELEEEIFEVLGDYAVGTQVCFKLEVLNLHLV